MTDAEITQSRLADMWDRHDPMPDGLVEKVLVAIETEDLDAEYELLHMIDRSHELAGARGVGDAMTIAFSGGAVSLLLRVSQIGKKACRVDGWVSPAQPMKVSVTQKTRTWDALVDGMGRFELPKLPTGLTRFWLFADDAEGTASPSDAERLFATPTFDL
ncbi:MAG: hypothetical protein ACRDPG_04260 [Nocardioidaceae bacterium]